MKYKKNKVKWVNYSKFLVRYSLFVFYFFFFSQLPLAYCQLPLRPAIHNFLPKEYSAYSQVWCAVQDKRGVTYFGAGQDVLEYDGATWRKISVKVGATVFSLACDSAGTIYVGTQGDFGYLEVAWKRKKEHSNNLTIEQLNN